MMILVVGLPGAGKTTVAKRLAAEHSAPRLTPDEWMIPLLGEPQASGKRDVLEGLMITLALQLLRLGTSVVLDFGCWARDERTCLRWLAEKEGASFRMAYVPVDRVTQLERIEHRQAHASQESFEMTAANVDRGRGMFEVPDPAELAGGTSSNPPASWSSWLDWGNDRWPSLSTG